MKITIIGCGYVGLVTGACFADFGFEVYGLDSNPKIVDSLQNGILHFYEPGLTDLVQRMMLAKRLCFKDSILECIPKSDVVFLAVGTPSKEDGSADLTYLWRAMQNIAPYLKDETLVVLKSTASVGTTRKLKEYLMTLRPELRFHMASNPEFLRQGSAINDFMRPDRVIVGIDDDAGEFAKKIMNTIYRPLYLLETPMVYTDFESSETIKYASNSFLAMKIAFINQISDFCDKIGANIQDVSKGIGLDGRIGRKFLHVSPGYGGSCFPKDTKAITTQAKSLGIDLGIIQSVIQANDQRKNNMVKMILDFKPERVGFLGVTFKPNTDDLRDAPSLAIIPKLNNLTLKAYDPACLLKPSIKDSFATIDWKNSAYDAATDMDLLVILTEWNEFRALDLARIAKLMRKKVILDLRNIYLPQEVLKHGIAYHSLGR